jgi:hypothetical protein
MPLDLDLLNMFILPNCAQSGWARPNHPHHLAQPDPHPPGYTYIWHIYSPHTRSHHAGCAGPICNVSGWVGSALLQHSSSQLQHWQYLVCNLTCYSQNQFFDMRYNCNNLKNILNYNISIALAINILKHSNERCNKHFETFQRTLQLRWI